MNIDTIRQLFEQKKWQPCIEACLKLIMRDSVNIEAWSLCAFCYGQIGRLQEGIECFEEALKIAKKHNKEHIFSLSLNLAEFYRRANMTLQAIALLQNLLPRDDENLHFNLAKCYGDLQDYERSIEHYMMAIKINPKDIHAIFNLANQQAAIGSFKLALKYYTLAYEGGMGDAGINLAQIYTNMDNLESAIALYEELEPHYMQDSHFYFNYGNALRYAGFYDMAEKAYMRALGLQGDARYAMNLSHLHLSLDNFAVGFALYEHRRALLPKGMPKHFLNFSLQDSKSILAFLRDKKVALYHEQGFGDSIMFARFLPLLSCKEKILFVPKELCKLFACFQIPCTDEAHNDYDVALPLPSLAFLFATDETLESSLHTFRTLLATHIARITHAKEGQTLPFTTEKEIKIPTKKVLESYGTYAQKESAKQEAFLTKNTQHTHFITHHNTADSKELQSAIKVGLNFSSNPNFQNAREKSIYARKLLESLPRGNFIYYSLQYEGIDSDIAREFGVIDMAGQISDFTDSAALLRNMDFVISIDSALAHLSASLGIPTAVLLYKRHDWRWGNFHRHDSTKWYDCTRLFIQQELHEWRDALENLYAFLTQKDIKNILESMRKTESME